MKCLTTISFILLFLSCNNNDEKWKSDWEVHKLDFKKVVELLKADKLKVSYGRSGYAIPDSINLKVPYGQLVFRETDFTYDSTYSILFYLDTTETIRRHQIIIYTDSRKRMSEYESTPAYATKIEENWYFINR